ncbi:MAG: VOC family protein [Streptosporangiales bacterium]|nr:VOC family protein [Streptosporangiales bacterium]
MATGVQITLDSPDPSRTAEFWAAALGYIVQPPPPGHDSWESWLTSMGIPQSEWNRASACIDPDGTGPRIFIQRVPEPKTAKNRMHLDLKIGRGGQVPLDETKRLIDTEVERLVALGATRLHPVEELGEYCVVMQDPDGNEFCVD